MDQKTTSGINDFVDFLQREFAKHKDLKHIQFGKWSLKEFKVTLEVFIHTKRSEVYFDIRELKENQNHFLHLLDNIVDQIMEKLNIQ